jgi:hypothetical protein
MKTKSLIIIAGICAASLTNALGTSVTTFGPLPGETFGGSGIPNDAVQITTTSGLGPNGSTVITMGLSATPRFAPGELANDGAGTFYVSTGVQWNFDFVGNIAGGGDLSTYTFKLYYDLDPAAGTSLANLGVWNLNAGQPAGSTSVRNSEYPGFNFLANGIAGAVTPPIGGFTFNLNAPGEYTFAMGVYDAAGAQVGDLDSINVKVNSVPDATSTAGLMVLSALGLLAIKKHVAKRRFAAEKTVV